MKDSGPETSTNLFKWFRGHTMVHIEYPSLRRFSVIPVASLGEHLADISPLVDY